MTGSDSSGFGGWAAGNSTACSFSSSSSVFSVTIPKPYLALRLRRAATLRQWRFTRAATPFRYLRNFLSRPSTDLYSVSGRFSAASSRTSSGKGRRSGTREISPSSTRSCTFRRHFLSFNNCSFRNSLSGQCSAIFNRPRLRAT